MVLTANTPARRWDTTIVRDTWLYTFNQSINQFNSNLAAREPDSKLMICS